MYSPHLQLVLLHGILQCSQEVSVLFLQPRHLALQDQQLLCPLVLLWGTRGGFRMGKELGAPQPWLSLSLASLALLPTLLHVCSWPGIPFGNHLGHLLLGSPWHSS